MLECQQRAFPYDYPQTDAGKSIMLTTAQEKLNLYCKRPPSKRVNYQNLCQPMPFLPTIGANFFYMAIPLERGVPVTGSLIYLPCKEDIQPKTKKEFWED